MLPRAASTSLAACRSCGLLAAAICCKSAKVYGWPFGPGRGIGSAGSGGSSGNNRSISRCLAAGSGEFQAAGPPSRESPGGCSSSAAAGPPSADWARVRTPDKRRFGRRYPPVALKTPRSLAGWAQGTYPAAALPAVPMAAAPFGRLLVIRAGRIAGLPIGPRVVGYDMRTRPAAPRQSLRAYTPRITIVSAVTLGTLTESVAQNMHRKRKLPP